MSQGALPVQAKASPSSSALEIMYSELISTGKISKEITHQPIKTNKFLEEGLPPTSTDRQEINQPATFSPSSSGQTWYVSTTGDNSSTCLSPDLPCATINAAINKANHGDVIKVSNHTYYFSGYPWDNEVVLISKSIELSGGWNSTFTTQSGHTEIDAQNQKRGIQINSGLSVSIISFAIHNGKSSGGAGIRNVGNTTLTDVLIFDNLSLTTYSGGGIENSGLMVINDSFIFNNQSMSGAGIYGGSGSVTRINHTAVYANIASVRGGGIDIGSYDGQLIIQDSTISNNVAGQSGGGVYTSKTTTLNNVTVANNHAGEDSGGIHTAYFGASTIFNSILVNNTYNQGYDNCGGYGQNYFEQSIDYPASCGYSISATIGEQPRWVDPKLGEFLASLGYYPLLADSPAIDTGNLSTCLEVDQRGVSRPQGAGCDLGAYEYIVPGQPHSLLLLSGDNQRIPMGFASQHPLSVAVIDGQGTPVSGVEVIFTTPTDGASAEFESTNSNITVISTNVHGIAQTSNLIANNLSGTYTVSASVIGVEPVVFHLENGAWYVSIDGNDSNNCRSPLSPCATINAAINKPDVVAGDVIFVSQGIYSGSGTTSVVTLSKNVLLSGGWDQSFNVQGGVTILDGQMSRIGIIVPNSTTIATIENFTIRNSYARGADGRGAGIRNFGELTIRSSSIYENLAQAAGAGIYNAGNLNLYNSSIYGNTSTNHGAGIVNTALMTINNSTISNNVSSSYGSHGGGLHNSGDLSIQNSIIASNQAGLVDARIAASPHSDCYNEGIITSLGNNIVQNVSGCSLAPISGDLFNINPKLGTFVKPRGYSPLLPGSPAINTGNPGTCFGEADQRGLVRDAQCDIGAYEYAVPALAAELVTLDGNNQQDPPTFNFGRPLQIIVLDKHGSPVPNISVTFTAPESGPSVSFSGENLINTTSGVDGTVSLPMTANNEIGQYSVTIVAEDVTPTEAELENGAWYVSLSGNDSNNCATPQTPCATIRSAIGKAQKDSTIMIETGIYSDGSTGISISKNLTNLAGWNDDFTEQNGKSTSLNHIGVGAQLLSYQAIHVVMDNLNLSSQGIYNTGTLTYQNGTIMGAVQAIDNLGFLTLINATISGNGQNTTGGFRGGIQMSDTKAVIKIVNSTITNNATGTNGGGGIENSSSNAGLVILNNSIVAGNSAEYGGPDCSGGSSGYVSLGNNLIGVVRQSPSGMYLCSGNWHNTDIVGSYTNPANPHLFEFADLGNNTWMHALKSSSPAFDTGAEIGCPAIDQRGISRPQSVACDMGAYEFVIPGDFGKTSPTNAAADQSLSLTLSWGASVDATYYEYCYSSTPGPCTQWHSAGPNTSVTLNDLAANYTYYWQVRAGGIPEADAGNWWSFTTTDTSACTWPAYTAPVSPTFGDVPMTVGHWSWVERLANSTITAGCGAGNFCPFSEVNRAQMAIFLLRAKHCGSSYSPPAVGASTGFADVPVTASYAPWVKQLAAEGITTGCGGGNFCPLQNVNRAQMAIFVLRVRHGSTYSPPAVAASTGFDDVSVTVSYAPWVVQLAAEDISAGCGGGNFCPLQSINRAQMAIFLVRAFGLP
jgi:hypothetical protein